MQEIIFANENHEKNYDSFLEKTPKEILSPANLSAIYLIAWVESKKQNIADQIIDFQTCSINLFSTMADWQDRMTQNAIFLAYHLQHDSMDWVNVFLDDSDWNKYFVQAFRIRYHSV